MDWLFTPVGVLLLGVMGVYFKAHAPMEFNGWIWSYGFGWVWVLYYMGFLAAEVIAPAWAIWAVDRRLDVLKGYRPLFLMAVVYLAVLPLRRVGSAGDLRLQGSGVPLVMMYLGYALALTRFAPKERAWQVCLAVYLCGTVCPTLEPIYNLAKNRLDASAEHSAALGMHDLSEIKGAGIDLAAQYMGSFESPAGRYLLKR